MRGRRSVGTCLRVPLLITIPFVLVFTADKVVISTTMYGDTSGVRVVRATADSSLFNELRRWTRVMTRGWDDADAHISGNNAVVARSTQRNALGEHDDIEAEALDIVQEPLSLMTTYRWQETVRLNYLGTEQERAAAPLCSFEYRITMPGAIRATSPVAQSVSGRTATWVLTADRDEYTIRATATAVRWDVIVILVYVGGYLTYRVLSFLARRARLRPRKI